MSGNKIFLFEAPKIWGGLLYNRENWNKGQWRVWHGLLHWYHSVFVFVFVFVFILITFASSIKQILPKPRWCSWNLSQWYLKEYLFLVFSAIYGVHACLKLELTLWPIFNISRSLTEMVYLLRIRLHTCVKTVHCFAFVCIYQSFNVAHWNELYLKSVFLLFVLIDRLS